MMLAFGTAVFAWTLAIVSADNNSSRQPDETLLYGQIAAGLVWVYKAWSWLPWDQRYRLHFACRTHDA